MANREGVTDAAALARGSEQTGESGTSITQRLNALMEEISNELPDAIQGNANTEFGRSYIAFRENMQPVIDWCSTNADNLNLGNHALLEVDDLSEGEFHQANQSFDGNSALSKSPNS